MNPTWNDDPADGQEIAGARPGSYAGALREKLGLRKPGDAAVRFPAGDGGARPWIGWGHYHADVVNQREFLILGRGPEMNAYEIVDAAPNQGLIEGLLQDGRVDSRIARVVGDTRVHPKMRFDLDERANLGALVGATQKLMKEGSLLDRAALRRSSFTVSIAMFYRLWEAAKKPAITLFAFDHADVHADLDIGAAANLYRSFQASGPIRGKGQVDGPFVANPSPRQCPECGAPMVEHQGSILCANQVKLLQVLETLDRG
ncbi:MAG: hypothetical protein ABJE95_08760 [Byssovorax sp.]